MKQQGNTITYTPEDLLDHHGIGAVITNENGDILMQEHIKFGFWTIPVGKTKPTQSVEAALREELLEECNITITSFKEIATQNFVYYRNGKDVVVKGHLFKILAYSGILQNNEPHKHKTQCFMKIDEIQKLPILSDFTLLWLKTIGFSREKRI